MPIFEQLQLEEALLRTSDQDWLIINTGSSPAIVVGISGKVEQVINFEEIARAPIDMIRRFSGGGTVVVDEKTLFVSWIVRQKRLNIDPFPEPILSWTTSFFQNAWNIDLFNRHENDYTIGNRKCGGNAQYLKRDKWLHHTTFLWDFEDQMMRYLKYPPKTPDYRAGRSHLDFMTRLKDYTHSKEDLITLLLQEATRQFGDIQLVDLETLGEFPEHRKSVVKINLPKGL